MNITGDNGPNVLTGTEEADRIDARAGDDTIDGAGGNDVILGGLGDDTVNHNVSTGGADTVDLGSGFDVVNVSGAAEVRLTFTSSRVGNGDPLDGAVAPQDGGLAVRLQAENGADGLTGLQSRYDDEAITFDGGNTTRFDVRDLVSGAQRGNQFNAVLLGNQASNKLIGGVQESTRNYYINGGAGNDEILGAAGNDFLVGGSGNDNLRGGEGANSYIGGSGNDFIDGGLGHDTVFFNVSTDGADQAILDRNDDTVIVTAAAGTANVRLTFTSAEVGNFSSYDGGTLDNQDGRLAVRLQAEDANGALTGLVSRFDDEGVTFVSQTPGMTFQVNDLVSGVTRGDQFAAVTLGDRISDTIDRTLSIAANYINGGQGNDNLTGGSGDDFIVGGQGDDRLLGNAGADTFIGGAGNDRILGGLGDDVVLVSPATDGADSALLGAGDDLVRVTAPTGTTNIRLTFTSAEVGNNISNDSGALLNQDGAAAVRLQLEDGSGALTGAVGRYDDEGITFVSTSGATTFDVRDLVSSAQRGNAFDIVTLGTHRADTINYSNEQVLSVYVNGGQGNDVIDGGALNDFLVGGAGNDTLQGSFGGDRFIGGGGSDLIDVGGDADSDIVIYAALGDSTASALGRDSIQNFVQGFDLIDLSAIDANTTNAAGTNDTFVFEFGGVFTNQAGEVIANDIGGLVLVEADTDGDGSANFAILVDTGPNSALTDSDFVL